MGASVVVTARMKGVRKKKTPTQEKIIAQMRAKRLARRAERYDPLPDPSLPGQLVVRSDGKYEPKKPKRQEMRILEGELDISARKPGLRGYTEDRARTILDLIANGTPLVHALKQVPHVTRQMVLEWTQIDEGFARLYERARWHMADYYADEIVVISDEARSAVSMEEIQAAKLRVDARKWVASRLLPHKWGDRVIHEGNPDSPVSVRAMGDAELIERATALLARLGSSGTGGADPGDREEGGT